MMESFFKKKLLVFTLMLATLFPTQAFAVVTGATSQGWNVYDPSIVGGGWGYRYGPSMILNADNSIDMWTCSPPPSGGSVWDVIMYKHSNDNGTTWGTESAALEPTSGSTDAFSNCDPGVIKFGGYYYIAYTSTTNVNGTDNDVYVARSTSPGGPYSKWNGSGWGGNPQPFIVYNDAQTDTYGAGEPSLVVNGTTLYIYYTWMSRDQVTGKVVNQTRVRTASTTNANWPGSTTYQGVAINRDIEGEDSSDMKYVPSLSKFIAISTAKRFGPLSYIKLYESTDGLTYKPATLPKNYINTFAHNAGITGDALGNFDTTKNNRIAYAYGTQWGYWYTAMNPISLSNTNLPAVPYVDAVLAGNGQAKFYFRTTGIAGETYKIKYSTTSGSYTTTVSGITGSPYTITGLTNGTPYYFVVAGSNANGDSGNSLQASTTPYNLTVSPRTGVSASSDIPGWTMANAIDGDLNTNWSSTNHAAKVSTEWITVDTGASRMIKRVTLTPRQVSELCFPRHYSIQVSQDNVNWVNADTSFGEYRLENPIQRAYDLKMPLYGRYVRIYATELTSDGNYNYMQLGDIKIEELPYSATASSVLNAGWAATNVLDGSASTNWGSINRSAAASTEYIVINTGAVNQINGVRVTPRVNGAFPVDFVFQSSNDGTTWTNIPGASYANYPVPVTAVQSFNFSSTVSAQYIRMYATKLGVDQNGYYFMQLNNIRIDTAANRTATASSSIWSPARVTDNQIDTYYSSTNHATANFNEWIAVDMGSTQNWTGVRIAPRPNSSFPVDFTLQSSTDGVNWTTIPGQSYTSYYNPGADTQAFQFSSLVSARYIKLNATKLSADSFGIYYLQLGEIFADR